MSASSFIRIGATLVILTFALFFILAALGYSSVVLHALNIPPMRPFFADLRTIPLAGPLPELDHLRIENPADPWGRPFNYPKIWVYLLQPFRICADPYFCLGSLQFLAYLALVLGLIWIVRSPASALVIVVLAVSPPVVLLLERGNNDGIVFLLVLAAVRWHGPFRTPLLMALAGGLKVYPVVALPLAFQPRNRLWFLLALLLASPLLVLTFSDFSAIFAATPVSDRISYGISSFALLLGTLMQQGFGSHPSGYALVVLSATLFLVAVLLAYWLLRSAYHRLADTIGRSPEAERLVLVFGTIFLATLIFSSNWAYRIVFLAPIACASIHWLVENRPRSVSDRLLLIGLNVAIFGTFWAFPAPHGQRLFNVGAFASAALLFPLVTLIAHHHLMATAAAKSLHQRFATGRRSLRFRRGPQRGQAMDRNLRLGPGMKKAARIALARLSSGRARFTGSERP